MNISKDGGTNVSLTQPPFNNRRPDEEAVVSDTLPLKYQGTSTDQQDMMLLGKKQVLRRNFRFITMLGFGSTVICSWEIVLPVFTFVLTDGGTPAFFWGFIAIASGMIPVYASIAEMASMCPTAGGQYHWVSEFAPPRYQRGLSYLTGWLCALGWQVFLASVAFMVGGIIQGLIALNKAEYVFEPWHATLLTIAVLTFAIVFNTVLANQLPMVEGGALVIHFVGFFAIFIPLWVLAPKNSTEMALFTFTNNGGWSSLGLSAMIGLTAPVSSLIGYDCSVHMSEELRDASLTMPKAIMWTVAPNAIFGLLMVVTLCYTLGDAEAVADTPTRQPFIQLFLNGTGSLTGTNVMVSIVVVCLTCCCISEVATASRQLWSFARDKGLPGSIWLMHVASGWNIPLRAVLVSLMFTCLLVCINLGSSVALNAINSLGAVSILSSYFITISCLVWRRLFGKPLPPRRWSLGRLGIWTNIAALCVLTPLWLFAFWPLARPVTPETMNWSSALFGGVMVLATMFYWAYGRWVFTGPVVLVKRDL